MSGDSTKYTQDNRPMRVKFSQLGKDDLLLERFTGHEAISSPFEYHLDLLAPVTKKIAFNKVLGQDATVTLTMPDAKERTYNGIVNRLSQGEFITSAKGTVEFIRFRAEVVPKFWLLKKLVRSRIFQQVSVLDILKNLFSGFDVDSSKIQDKDKFAPRDYCVQYRESDFDFSSRLMEEEGIFYFFKPTDKGHQMVLANIPHGHPDALLAGQKAVFQQVSGAYADEERIVSWEKTQELRSGKYTLWDHCFEKTSANQSLFQNLAASKDGQDQATVGTVSHALTVGGNDKLEIYDYPGGYAHRFDGIAPGGTEQASNLAKIDQDNARTVEIRMQRESASAVVIRGEGTYRRFSAGSKFTLDKHFDGNGQYVIARLALTATMENAYTSDAPLEFLYQNEFECLPFSLPFRPERVTPRARVEGTQTAVVVGPKGEEKPENQEIFTDKYGRVKVKFPWDRKRVGGADTGPGTNGQSLEKVDDACWVRVGSPWAGKGWGMVHIPRIGQEVIVDFLDGDPDRPLIIGSVYNAANMPPYTLPDNMTQSGLKTRSTLKGADTNFNELRFEDKKGSEEVYFHAEKDFNRVVENNDTLTVGSKDSKTCPEGSQTISVYKDRTETVETGNETVTIKKGNRTVTVSEGNDKHEVSKGKRDVIVESDDTHTVRSGNRTANVNIGNETLNVKTGNRAVTIDVGNDSLTLKLGNQTTKLNLGASSTEAMQSITLKVGPSQIQITPAGITIKGMMITIEGEMVTQIKGLMTQVNGDGMLMLKGGLTMIN